MAIKSSPTVTRDANTTAYTANDVVGGVISFPEFKPGVSALLTSADLLAQITAIPSGMTSFTLFMYDGSPPSAYADNAAHDVPSGDRSYLIGSFSFGTMVDLGSTLQAQVDQINKHICPDRGLYGYLVTAGAFTPAANSEIYVPRLRAIEI